MEDGASLPNWNCFARELQAVLGIRGKTLNHLEQAGVYREEIRRLRRSLLVHNSFPLLTPRQMEMVIFHYGLIADEVLRLRAAIVVTAIQRTLFRRISADEALEASNEIFPIVLRAMQLNKFSAVRHDEDVLQQEHSDLIHSLDRPLELAFDALDRGALAFHTSQQSRLQSERLRFALMAKEEYATAIGVLDQVGATTKDDPTWGFWWQRALDSIASVDERLDELGYQESAAAPGEDGASDPRSPAAPAS
jgi:hypothetical protein